MRAILLLVFFQVRSSLRKVATDPRKLIPLLVLIAGYIYNLTHRGLSFFATNSPYQGGNLDSGLLSARAVIMCFLALSVIANISSGFAAVYLSFVTPDLDYLLPSPISRRATLALKALRVNATALGVSALLWTGFGLVVRPMIGGMTNHAAVSNNLGQWALFFFFAGCTQLSLAISAHIGKRQTVYVITQFSFFLIVVGLLALAWFRGPEAVSMILNSKIFGEVFFPCRWTADAMVLPLTGHSALLPRCLTALFFGASSVILFARSANFYETAFFVTLNIEQLREARKRGGAGTGDTTLLFARQYDGRREARRRDYTVPAFGTGAMAVFWANLAAAAKRPWVNFIAPCAIGVLVGSVAIWQPYVTNTIVGLMVAMLGTMILTGGTITFMPVAQRQPLVGPMPIAAWKMAAAEIVPPAIMGSLPVWALAATLAIGRVPDSSTIALALAVSAPLIIAGLTTLPFVLSISLSNLSQDVMGVMLGMFSLSLAAALLLACYVPMLAAPALAGLAPWQTILLSAPGCMLVTWLSFSLAGRAYSNVGSIGEERSLIATLRKLPKLPRRWPDIDEGLWLAVIAIAGGVYDQFWLGRYGFLALVGGNEAIYLGLTFSFVWLGRYAWRAVLSCRRPSAGQLIGALSLSLGILPWVAAINLAQRFVWHALPAANNALLHYLATALAAHPVAAPLIIGGLAGVCEELLFRGPLQSALVRRFGPWRGILACAFLFAAFHLDYSGLIFRTVIGIVLGWIVWRGKSIFPAMLAHAVIDATVFGYYSWLVHTRGIGVLEAASHPHFMPLVFISGLAGGSALLALGAWIFVASSHARSGDPNPIPPVFTTEANVTG